MLDHYVKLNHVIFRNRNKHPQFHEEVVLMLVELAKMAPPMADLHNNRRCCWASINRTAALGIRPQCGLFCLEGAMFKKLLKKKLLQVWHHDSPGIRVYVRRNVLQDLFLEREFSSVFEKHVTPEPGEEYEVRITMLDDDED